MFKNPILMDGQVWQTRCHFQRSIGCCCVSGVIWTLRKQRQWLNSVYTINIEGCVNDVNSTS